MPAKTDEAADYPSVGYRVTKSDNVYQRPTDMKEGIYNGRYSITFGNANKTEIDSMFKAIAEFAEQLDTLSSTVPTLEPIGHGSCQIYITARTDGNKPVG